MVDCPVCEIAVLPMGRTSRYSDGDPREKVPLYFCYKCKVLYRGGVVDFKPVHVVMKWVKGSVMSVDPRLEVEIDVKEFNGKNPFVPGGLKDGTKTVYVRKVVMECEKSDYERSESILDGNDLTIYSMISTRLHLSIGDDVDVMFKEPWDFGVTPSY